MNNQSQENTNTFYIRNIRISIEITNVPKETSIKFKHMLQKLAYWMPDQEPYHCKNEIVKQTMKQWYCINRI